MNPPSPTQLAGAEVTVRISAGGQPLNSSYQLISLDIWTGVNKIPKARLVLADGSPNQATFPISETTALIPGAALEISLGYDGEASPVFAGLVYQQGIEVVQDGFSTLIVEAADRAMVMTLARKNAVFDNLSDAAVMRQLIEQAGLQAQVSATSPVQPSIVQFYCSDWDLLLLRAQMNGMVAITADAGITVAPPDTGSEPVLTLTYGMSILDFRAEMDASTQYAASAMQSFAWDPATQAVTASGHASSSVAAPGNIDSETLARVFGVKQFVQQTAATLPEAELTTWSSAGLMLSRLAKIRGMVRFQGSALAVTGAMVTLAGLGDRYNGAAWVSGVHQQVAAGKWSTSTSIGLSPQWFAATAPQIAAPGASGQLPAAANLQTGLVVKTDADPDGQYRVQVSLPLLQADGATLWARLGSLYATNGAGTEFYPEVGDEVVVAFMNGDPRFPVILGSLYSQKNPPPVPPDAANNQKAIVTRGKLRIDFYEDAGAVEISTPGKQSVRLDDQAGTLTLKDSHGNSITMAAGGISIDSASAITLSAKTDISLAAQGSLSLKGSAGVSIGGATVAAKADTSFSAQGGTDAKLASGGMVTVQGALVKIN